MIVFGTPDVKAKFPRSPRLGSAKIRKFCAQNSIFSHVHMAFRTSEYNFTDRTSHELRTGFNNSSLITDVRAVKLIMRKPVDFGLGQFSVGEVGSIGFRVEGNSESIVDAEVLVDIRRKRRVIGLDLQDFYPAYSPFSN